MIPPIVDAAWLAARREEVVLADVRWYPDGSPGRAAYEAGHIPGAVHVDLDRWLAAEPSPQRGRHPLPDPERFAEGMSRAGVGDGDAVVAYDDAGGIFAARLVWMLRVTGHDAALLDGGLQGHDGALALGSESRPPRVFTARPWPEAALADVAAARDRGNVVIDARDPARYRGESEPLDPRAGHVPGARSLPCRANLGPGGRLAPDADLRRAFEAAGVTGDAPVVSYCGSGVTACHNLLVMEHLGLPPGRLFPGSWSQYSHDPALPVATGDG